MKSIYVKNDKYCGKCGEKHWWPPKFKRQIGIEISISMVDTKEYGLICGKCIIDTWGKVEILTNSRKVLMTKRY